MTNYARKRRASTRPKKVSKGEDRRLVRNNLPYGLSWWVTGRKERPQWTEKEREQKLKWREDLIRYGLVIILSVAGSSVTFILNMRQAILDLQTDMTVFRYQTNERITAQQRELERLNSYFGVPPPRNPGH